MAYIKTISLLTCIIVFSQSLKAQCSSFISSFPYSEGFETSSGGWFQGGTGSDWAWGTPDKAVISSAGNGARCWIVGGLTGNSYTNSEASWLQSPCFNFSSLQYPYITFKVFWEMEQRFDGANLQYSINNGASWLDIGSSNEVPHCLNDNWYNYSPVTYLASLSTNRSGWSGNIQPSIGSCLGGNGSNGWLTAKHVLPMLAGQPSVIFRFTFGAGSICNDFDGFAIDDIIIEEAPPNAASFDFACINSNTVSFTNTSGLCPLEYKWNFGDPSSAGNNTSIAKDPTHTFSGPGLYTVSLTVGGQGNAPSTVTKEVIILGLSTTVITPADCNTNNGGSAMVNVAGSLSAISYEWNTSPIQTTAIANDLGADTYKVIVNAAGACADTAEVTIPLDLSCIGIYFPTAFTPNDDGLNDGFGPLGSLSSLSNYSFSIYNRWGERIFSSSNPFQKWNGRLNGKAADIGSYAWFAQYSLQGQPIVLRKGTVLLVK